MTIPNGTLDRHFSSNLTLFPICLTQEVCHMCGHWASLNIQRNDKKSLNILKMVVVSMSTCRMYIVRLIFGKVCSRFVNCWICSIIMTYNPVYPFERQKATFRTDNELSNNFDQMLNLKYRYNNDGIEHWKPNKQIQS